MAYGLGAKPVVGFAYGGDVGQSSWQAIEAFAKQSNVPVNVTAVAPDVQPSHSDDGGYHSTHNAVDFSGQTDNMDKFAAWCMKSAPYILELIHSSNSAPGGGYFVHNGQVVGSSVYSSVLADHYNHVHLAMTPSGVKAAGGGGGGAAPTTGGSGSGGGILQPIFDLFDQITGFFKLATNPYTYKRLAYGIIGALCIFFGLMLMYGGHRADKIVKLVTGKSIKGNVKGQAKKAVKSVASKGESKAKSDFEVSKPADTGNTFEQPAESPKADVDLNKIQQSIKTAWKG